MKEYLILVMAIIFLTIGVTCLLWPETIQGYALKWSVRGLGKYNPLLDWMKTRSYILSLRIIGIIAIGVFIMALFIFIKTQKM